MASGMPWAPGCAAPLEARISFYLARMFDGEKLSDNAAHGVATDDRLLDVQMLEQGDRVAGKHANGIFLHRFARLAGAAVVEHDDPMIAREFRDLVKLPRLMIEAGDAAKQKWRSVAMNFVVNLGVPQS